MNLASSNDNTPTDPPRLTTPDAACVALFGPHELQAETPCIGCGYDLRGLSSDARCPECGEAIERSLRGFLNAVPPEYARRLAWGTVLLLFGVALDLLSKLPRAWLLPLLTLNVWMDFVLVCAQSLASVTGIWLVTTRPADGVRQSRGTALRWIARIAVTLNAAYKPAFTLLILLGYGGGMDWAMKLVALFMSPVACAWTLIAEAAIFATLLWFGKLAKRMAHRRLEARTRLVMWGLGVSLALWDALVLVTFYYVRWARASGHRGVIGPLMDNITGPSVGAMRIAYFLFAIAWGLLLLGYRRRFAARGARGNPTIRPPAPPSEVVQGTSELQDTETQEL